MRHIVLEIGDVILCELKILQEAYYFVDPGEERVLAFERTLPEISFKCHWFVLTTVLPVCIGHRKLIFVGEEWIVPIERNLILASLPKSRIFSLHKINLNYSQRFKDT